MLRINQLFLTVPIFLLTLLNNETAAYILPEYQERCKNASVSEFDLSEYLRVNSFTYAWDRPKLNSAAPVAVGIVMGITSLAGVVS